MNVIQGTLFGDTLQEAKDDLERNVRKGTRCKCCNCFVKEYQANIHSTLAQWLILLYLEHKKAVGCDAYVRYDNERLRIPGCKMFTDYARLKHWKLIEPMPKDPKNKKVKASGSWRITKTGRDFVEQRITLPKYAKIRNNEFLGFDGEIVSILQCLPDSFNYTEYMNR